MTAQVTTVRGLPRLRPQLRLEPRAGLPHGPSEWCLSRKHEVIQAIRLLTRFGQVAGDPDVKEEDFQKELTQADPNTRLELAAVAG